MTDLQEIYYSWLLRAKDVGESTLRGAFVAGYKEGQASAADKIEYLEKGIAEWQSIYEEIKWERDEAVNALRLRMMQIADLKAQQESNAKNTTAYVKELLREIDELKHNNRDMSAYMHKRIEDLLNPLL